MKKLIALAAVLCLMTGCSSAGQVNNGEEASAREFYAMDTVISLTAYGENAETALDAAEAEVERLDDLWSIGNADSEISLINTDGRLTLSEDTAEVVGRALEMSESTGGAFDITVLPLMELWGFTGDAPHLPDPADISALLPYVDSSALTFDGKTLILPEGVRVDLGGIAKGYAGGRLAEIYKENGVESGIIALGGNVQAVGTKPDGTDWHVAVKNPESQLFDADYLGVLECTDCAVVTSGGYERYFEENGTTYHHILDPKTGYPADSGLLSVTVVSTDGTLADGLSTALFVMGADEALNYWRAHTEQFDLILAEKDGTITVTAGIKDCFSSSLPFTTAE